MGTRSAPAEVPFFQREVETLERGALRALQLERLRLLLAEVAAANRFYRHKWQAAGAGDVAGLRTLAELRRLPFTTKQELLADQEAHPPFGTVLTYPVERYTRLHMTSGTTGRPLRWLDTPESWEWWCRCWGFVYRAAGIGPADTVFFPFSFGPFIGFWAGFDGAVRLGALAIPGGGQDSALRLRTMREVGATVLVCTPSYALRLAQVAHEQGWDPATLPVRVTIHAGEPGASIPATKARIAQAWGARCVDHYGMTEVGAVGFECTAGGLHVNETEFVAEVLDPRTGEVADEGEGELVVTNLGRVGSPVIRYRTGDRVRLVTAPCPCGRTLARLDGGVLGRVDDMLVIRGVNVFPSAIEEIVRRHPEVDEFRLEVYRQDEMDQLRVLLEIDEGRHAPATADRIVAAVADGVRQTLGLRVDARAVPAGTLPRFELKARRVVRVAT
ncbi:MAG: AMP-binding protein [Armatimonadota bacterium]|nr:AMP-binding protein [Armatimonadota bacterium]MDR7486417.1 AMP-binding protein [Armatimonadota bacterium]MDR7532550.1 AMP-binding protein [Armatimonadota bacterium]MDR7535561.1 AMP-binding protein [Armatimonadota bacterium]